MRNQMFKVSAVVMSAVWLAGCATPGGGGPTGDAPGTPSEPKVATGPGGCTYLPGTEPKQGMNQTTAMVIGGLVGAVAGRALAGGSTTGKRNSATLLGAVAGAFAGNALANNFKVTEEPSGNIKVAMPGGLLFPTGSAGLSADARTALKDVPAQINKYCGVQARVVGHTDNVGSAAANMTLSENRARAVVTALTSAGLDASRVTVSGAGPNEPIAANTTPDGRQQNRRVEIFIIPPAPQQ
jgi:outer membrane protein OmpA-like peptidoglycan-associated protein